MKWWDRRKEKNERIRDKMSGGMNKNDAKLSIEYEDCLAPPECGEKPICDNTCDWKNNQTCLECRTNHSIWETCDGAKKGCKRNLDEINKKLCFLRFYSCLAAHRKRDVEICKFPVCHSLKRLHGKTEQFCLLERVAHKYQAMYLVCIYPEFHQFSDNNMRFGRCCGVTEIACIRND